jgi:hypothetical protein
MQSTATRVSVLYRLRSGVLSVLARMRSKRLTMQQTFGGNRFPHCRRSPSITPMFWSSPCARGA